jgi:hypothetical protein
VIENVRLSRPELTLDPRHDGRHALDPAKPYDRESVPFIVNIPEEGISFFTYTWVNGEGRAGAMVCLFGPGVGEEQITLGLPERPISDEMDFSDWRIDAFTMRHDLKFRSAEFAFTSDEVDLSFTFEGSHPPYAYSAHKDGCPPFCANDRIEQSGRAIGTLRLRDRTIAFNAAAHRDHSWGTRDWKAMVSYRWFVGQVGDTMSIHFWHLNALGQTYLRGYVAKDGLMAEISGIDISWTLDEQFRQKTLDATVRDEAGRTTILRAEFFSHGVLIPSPDLTLNEAGARMWLDGAEGAGWLEFAWQTDYLRHIRSIPEYAPVPEA